ncbi:hypothetical protein [Piscinibacter gummiphilus]|uniref:Uncharacterized protein n=1 Tax=Piscinibacter gummiphilus TaxID=946333 RepID=A0ABZ0CVU7_9BURK|nr:hypothetical protein [Piscinibacter gummiphilus]WOB09092.1 hypothetical protein RXV79_03315 [Piscinibacter gummiphilus]
MNRFRMTTAALRAGRFGLVLGLAAGALSAAARNTEHLFPIQTTLATPEARAAIGDDVSFLFGGTLPDGFVITDDNLKARGKADPRPSVLRPGTLQLSDEEACRIAFINAMADLARQARKAGSKTVLGIVSHYDDKVRDDKERYECHSGQTRSVVDLKAMLATPGRPGMVTLIGKGAVSAQHRSPVPPASGFAEADDVNAVPLTDAGRDRYRHYLSLPSPKAFVVFEGGQTWRFYHSDPDAMTKALDYCQSHQKVCWLYAVDHRVVWQSDPGRRIGRSLQLGNE